jgi:predicted O-methyltransferase YrrM
MVDLRQAARVAGLAVTRPVEFTDRFAGRRERDQQDVPPVLDAPVAEPIAVAHSLAGADGVGCCAELAEVRAGILGRVTGEHHHDGGTSLAEMLWVLVRHGRPAVVVETGVARGISSAFVLDAMQRNGHGRLWSIDLPPITADWGRQTGIAVAPGVRDRWTYVRGSSRRKLRTVLARCGPVDLFVHDGLHTAENMLFEMRAVWPSLRPGGFLVADDVDHNDAVLTFAAETGVDPVLVREPVKHNVVGVFPR